MCFVLGSVLFLPALQHYAATAAGLFIVGSVIYLAVTVHDFIEATLYYRQHKQSRCKTVLEFFALTGYIVACLLFVFGSVLFLPDVGLEAQGAWCFIAGSLLYAAGATVNVTQITEAGTLVGMQLLNAVAVSFIIGSILFLVASIPYLWAVEAFALKQTLFSYLASEFIFASVLFLAGGVVNFYRAYRMHLHRNQPPETG